VSGQPSVGKANENFNKHKATITSSEQLEE